MSENWMDRTWSFTYFSSFLPGISQVGSMLPWWRRRTSLFNTRNAPLTLKFCSAAIIWCTLALVLFTIFVQTTNRRWEEANKGTDCVRRKTAAGVQTFIYKFHCCDLKMYLLCSAPCWPFHADEIEVKVFLSFILIYIVFFFFCQTMLD